MNFNGVRRLVYSLSSGRLLSSHAGKDAPQTRNGAWNGSFHGSFGASRFIHATGSLSVADRNYYHILGVRKNASAVSIEKAYCQLAEKLQSTDAKKQSSTDAKKAKKKFEELQRAYEEKLKEEEELKKEKKWWKEQRIKANKARARQRWWSKYGSQRYGSKSSGAWDPNTVALMKTLSRTPASKFYKTPLSTLVEDAKYKLQVKQFRDIKPKYTII